MVTIRLKTRFRYRSYYGAYRTRVLNKIKRVLFRVGGYTRTVMQRSMPLRGGRMIGPATAGLPPRARRGSGGGLRWVLFDVNMGAWSVTIGPGRTHPKNVIVRRDRTIFLKHRKPVPKLLNESGTSPVTIQWHDTGNVQNVFFKYRRFPISDFKPTVDVAVRKFRDLVVATKL